MKEFKVGDILRTSDYDIASQAREAGADPERMVVRSVSGSGGVIFTWESETMNLHYAECEFELATVTDTSAIEFIINGSSMLFTSQEDAENYAMHSGNYTDGCTVEIAQVIRRAVVKRTVSVSLEDSQ